MKPWDISAGIVCLRASSSSSGYPPGRAAFLHTCVSRQPELQKSKMNSNYNLNNWEVLGAAKLEKMAKK
jgi:hypothetical protein